MFLDFGIVQDMSNDELDRDSGSNQRQLVSFWLTQSVIFFLFFYFLFFVLGLWYLLRFVERIL